MTRDELNQVIDSAEKDPKKIAAAVSGLPDSTMRYKPAPELVAQFGLLRHHNLNLLRRIKEEDLEKGAFHPELNRKVTLSEMVGMLSRHGPNHLEQIERIKKQAAQS